ncbi:hypothetical protein HFN78_35215 [Rhizobium laguerreae]|uniref:hypothetical protein n=1 Tax=Rhizobium laguerreae TaxID=1076926 RepID=UPI001C909605|nr:hypothetical protein [Rhizobium laguerreae]MBY3476084.1 hypothetical protein [Rhizobium laguerreae]MBY3521078.1 hypothetical protein [Rhizobium laguerreae]
MAVYASETEGDFSSGLTIGLVISIAGDGVPSDKVIVEFGTASPDFRMTVGLDASDSLYLAIRFLGREVFRSAPVAKEFFCDSFHGIICNLYAKTDNVIVGEIFIDGKRLSYSENSVPAVPPFKFEKYTIGGSLEAEKPSTFEVAKYSAWAESPLSEEVRQAIAAEYAEILAKLDDKKRVDFKPSEFMAKLTGGETNGRD